MNNPHPLDVAAVLAVASVQAIGQLARLSWCLPTSRVELLVGAKPRGASLERYGFRFTVVGQQGRERA